METYNDQTQVRSKGECPVCFKIPRAQIFQCVNGHSICDVCSAKVELCPTCRSSGARVRNRLAESLLDDVKFNCSWSSKGCQKTMLRSELSAHEDSCDKNPNIIKLCASLGEPLCQYKFTSTWLSEPENCKAFVNHMKSCHGYDFIDNLQVGTTYQTVLNWAEIQKAKCIPTTFTPQVKKIIRLKFFRIKNPYVGKDQLFFQITWLELENLSDQPHSVSWIIVCLTPETIPVMTVRRSIVGAVNTTIGGQYSSPVLSWTLKPISIDQFMNMVNGGMTSLIPFSVPVDFLIKYYLSEDETLTGTLTVECAA